jgi:molecular chaperone GrpE
MEGLVAGNNRKDTAGEATVMDLQDAEAIKEAEAEIAAGTTDIGDSGEGGAEDLQVTATHEAEKKDLQDKMLRMAAEFENYKKRMIRERETSFKYAEEALLKELLPSIDNLERALAHQNDSSELKVMREGVDLTLKALMTATAKFGLTPIDSVGQPFDPNLHEALAMEASDTVPPQSVLREFEKGYFYKDRLLRAAKVVVSKGCE